MKMILDDPELRGPMDKLMDAIQRDKSVLDGFWGYEAGSVTAESLGNLAGNHLFDDCCQRFDISLYESYMVRSYLTIGCDGGDWGCQVRELHEVYPRVMQQEGPEFMGNINSLRASQGLDPIVLD